MANVNRKSEIINRKLVIGLLGGIGSGKSAVARLLAEARAVVISGDALAHEVLRHPEVKEKLVGRWGAGVLGEDGEVRRKTLAGIVFADQHELKSLEAIVHPWIKRRIEEEIGKARDDPRTRLVVLDAAIMLEAGWDGVCDELIFVDAPKDQRLRRVAAGRGWSEKEVEQRENSQMPLAEKAGRADHILDNSGSPDDLREQVRVLLRRWGFPPAAGPPEPTRVKGTPAAPAGEGPNDSP